MIAGYDVTIQDNVIFDVEPKIKERLDETKIGANSVIRSGSVIYKGVTTGHNFRTGHNVLIREKTIIGDNVLIGTNTVIDGNCVIGDNISIQTGAYIPTNTTIESNVFIGPKVVFTNDKYPIRIKDKLNGPIIKEGASIGANSTILPGVTINKGAMVGAGSVVTKDVPEWCLVAGVPARIIKGLPDELRVLNQI
jgi:acetyltransferase-like isoleucine patch superfamily enzyme